MVDVVDVLYVELDDCAVLGSFVDHTIDVPNQSGKKVNKRTSGKASTQKEFKKPKCDQVKTIRSYFTKNCSTLKSTKRLPPPVIELE